MSTQTNAPTTRPTTIIDPPLGSFRGHVSRISVENSADNSRRFVMSIVIPGGEGQRPRYEYFSTPRSSPDSIRINAQQLRNAFPELMICHTDDEVFMHLLTNRSKFIGKEVDITVSAQLDERQQPKRGTKGQMYTNVRLEANSSDISAEDAKNLWSSAAVPTTTGAASDPAAEEDIPM